MFLRVLIVAAATVLAAATQAETVKGPESSPCDYSVYPSGRIVKLRGLLQRETYGGGRSTNAAKWTTAHILSIEGTICDFEVHAPHRLDLASYEGYIVDITGRIAQGGAASFYTLTAQRIHRVRSYHG